VIVPAILALLASPPTYIGFIVKYGKWTRDGSGFTGGPQEIAAAMNSAAVWTACLLLAGWVLVEGGLLTLKPRGILRVLLRIPLYSFIVGMFGWIGLGRVLSFLLDALRDVH
jgi:hypothetical protein